MAITSGRGRSYRMPNDRRPGVHVDGAKELRRAFKEFGMDAKDMKVIHKELAAMVVPYAKANLPPSAMSRDKRKRPPSGNLQKTVTAWSSKTTAEIRAGTKSGSVIYAGVQEYGWPAKNIYPKFYLSKAAAWIRPQVMKKYNEHIQNSIKRTLALKSLGDSMGS